MGRVQSVIEIDERRIIPQSLLEFFPRNHLMWPFQQDFQNLQRVAGQPQTSRQASAVHLTRHRAEMDPGIVVPGQVWARWSWKTSTGVEPKLTKI